MAILQRNLEADAWINPARTALLTTGYDAYDGSNNPGDVTGVHPTFGPPYYIAETQTSPSLDTSFNLDGFDIHGGAKRHIFIVARSPDGGNCYAAIYRDGIQLTTPITFTDQHWRVHEIGSYISRVWIDLVWEEMTLRVWSDNGDCRISLLTNMSRSVIFQAEDIISGDGVLLTDANATPSGGTNNALRSPDLSLSVDHQLADIPNLLEELYSPGISGYETIGVAHVYRVKPGGGQPWWPGVPYKQESDHVSLFSLNTMGSPFANIYGATMESYSLGNTQDVVDYIQGLYITPTDDLIIYAHGASNPAVALLYQQVYVDQYIINRGVESAYFDDYTPITLTTSESFNYTDDVPDLHTHYEIRIIDPITEIEVFYDPLLPGGMSYTLYNNLITPGTYYIYLLAYYADGSYGYDYRDLTVVLPPPIPLISMWYPFKKFAVT